MDEKELVQRMKAKDKTAFDALYEKYKNTLLRMAYLVSGQMYDAEDIVQEHTHMEGNANGKSRKKILPYGRMLPTVLPVWTGLYRQKQIGR